MNDNPVPSYCKRCEYPLIGLPKPICPECGTPFDLNVPSTFVVGLRAHRRKRWLKRGAVALAVLLLLFAVSPRRILKGTITLTCPDCGESLVARRWEPEAPRWIPFRYPGLYRLAPGSPDSPKADAGSTCELHRHSVAVKFDLYRGGWVSGSAIVEPGGIACVNGNLVTPDSAGLTLKRLMAPTNDGIMIGGFCDFEGAE